MTLRRSAPSSQGVDGAGIVDFLDTIASAGIELHSFMLLRHGAVVAETWWEPYDRETPHLLYSLSKSFTAVAAGIAESEGLLRMSDRLSDHLDEAAGYGSAAIADALRMSVGHLFDPVLDPSNGAPVLSDEDLRSLLRDYAPERPPGEVFTYDQLATFAVAKIVERVSGSSLLDYLRPRVLEPIGATEARWLGGDANPGFTGLYLRTESIAAFGQLLLQEGQWEGKQLVPAAWVRIATTQQMANDSEHRFPPGQPVEPDSAQGYGYQFWIGRHGYHAGGAYGQTSLVLPEHDAVVALTASTQLGQTTLDAIWAHILPALGDDAAERASEAADARLAERLRGLAVPTPVAGLPELAARQAKATLGTLATVVTALRGEAADPIWPAIAAKAEAWTGAAVEFGSGLLTAPSPLDEPASRDASAIVFTRAEPDETVPSVRFGGIGDVDLPELTSIRLVADELVLTIDDHTASLRVGARQWLRGTVPGEHEVPFESRGGWAPNGSFEAELRMIEGPHVGYLALDPATATFTFTWREPTLAGRGLTGYRV